MQGPSRLTTPGSTPSNVWFGSCVAIWLAKTAINTRSARTTSPTTAERWRRTLPRVSRHRLLARAAATAVSETVGPMGPSGVGVAGETFVRSAIGSTEPDPGVEIAVRHVDDQVHDHVRDRDDQCEALDDHVVAAGDRLVKRPPDAGQVEHGFGEDGPREKRAELQPDDGHDRQQRVARGVAEDHAPLAE